MLIAGVIAFVPGALQFWLNKLLFGAVFAKDYVKAALLVPAKLALYGGCIALLMLRFRAFVIPAAVGFGAGFLLCTAVYAALSFGKKDGETVK